MADRQRAAVGQVSVEQPLPRQAAVAQRLEIFVRLPEDALAGGVDRRVDQCENPVFLVRTHDMLPEVGADGGKGRGAAEKPPAAHAAGVGHDEKDKNENQRHAGVL